MYWCEVCDDFTEGMREDGFIYHSEVDSRCYEPYTVVKCDFCGSYDLSEADRCACGEWKRADDVACRDCRKMFRKDKLAFLEREMLELRLPSGVINDLDESEDVAC